MFCELLELYARHVMDPVVVVVVVKRKFDVLLEFSWSDEPGTSFVSFIYC